MSEHAETDIRLRFLTFPMKDKSAQRYYIPYDTDDIINTSDAEGSTASEVLTALNTTINDLKGSIAEPFDPTKAYSAGDYVLYEGDLYKFTEDHDAGSWTGSDATEVNILEELDSLNTTVNDLKGNIAEPFDPTKAYSAGDYVLYEGDLYKFTEDHDPGSWTGSDASIVSVSDELDSLNTAVNNLKGNIAESFDPTKAYSAGDYVLYEGDLYKFTEDHDPGSWTGSDAEQTSIADGLASLADVSYSTDDIINLSDAQGSNVTEAFNTLLGNLASAFDPSKDYTEGQLVLYEGILHQFTEDHPAGPWIGSDIEQTSLGDELDLLISKCYLTVTLDASDGGALPWQDNDISVTVVNRFGNARYTYEGHPITILVEYGETYTITGDLVPGYWNRPSNSITISQLLGSIVLSYETTDSIDTFPKAKLALSTGSDLSTILGNQLITEKDGKSMLWDIVDYNGDEITLMLHNCVFNGSPYVSNDGRESLFDERHAVFYASSDIPSGNYYFKRQVSSSDDTFYFTLLQPMPTNSIMFINDLNNYSSTVSGSFTILQSHNNIVPYETGALSLESLPNAEEFTALASIVTCNNKGYDNKISLGRAYYGGNNIGDSVLFNWLNSYASVGEIISQTLISNPYVAEVPGFLNNFTQEDLDCLEDAVWSCNSSNYWEVPASLGGSSVPSSTYTITGKFCVPSRIEIFGNASSGATVVDDGSTQFQLFSGASDSDRIKYYASRSQEEKPIDWCLRTPVSATNTSTYYVGTDGQIKAYYVGRGATIFGIAPICKIKGHVPD